MGSGSILATVTSVRDQSSGADETRDRVRCFADFVRRSVHSLGYRLGDAVAEVLFKQAEGD
jgi:hypothetical protein